MKKQEINDAKLKELKVTKEAKTFFRDNSLQNVTLGADPEIEFHFLDASVLTNSDKNKWTSKYERLINAFDLVPHSTKFKIGTDGNSAIAELRPKKSNDAILLTKELENLIKKLKVEFINSYILQSNSEIIVKATAGNGKFYPLGGHIHFGHELLRNSDKARSLCKYLDILSIFLKQTEFKHTAIKRRLRSGFGKLTAYELKRHGFEYRTLNSFIIEQRISAGIFALYHSVAVDFVNNYSKKHKIRINKDFDALLSIFNENESTVRTAYANHNISALKSLFSDEAIINAVKKLTLYKKNYNNYKSYIDYLISRIIDDKNKWNSFAESRDIIQSWGFLKETSTFNFDFFIFNTTDDFLSDIKEKYLQVDNNKATAIIKFSGIYVYGVSQDRNFDFRTNNLLIQDAIQKFYKSKNTNVKIQVETLNRAKIELGIHRSIRENQQDLIKELLLFIKQYIIENLKVKNYSVFKREQDKKLKIAIGVYSKKDIEQIRKSRQEQQERNARKFIIINQDAESEGEN